MDMCGGMGGKYFHNFSLLQVALHLLHIIMLKLAFECMHVLLQTYVYIHI